MAKIQQRLTLRGLFFNICYTHLLYTFATCTFPNFSPNFSWDDCNTKEKFKTKVIQLLILAWREGKLLQGVLWEMRKCRIAGKDLNSAFILRCKFKKKILRYGKKKGE